MSQENPVTGDVFSYSKTIGGEICGMLLVVAVSGVTNCISATWIWFADHADKQFYNGIHNLKADNDKYKFVCNIDGKLMYDTLKKAYNL